MIFIFFIKNLYFQKFYFVVNYKTEEGKFMKKLQLINLFTSGILFILSGLFISILTLMKVIPIKYFIIIMLIYGFILIFILFITVNRRFYKLKMLIILLSFIFICLLGMGLKYLNSTVLFMNKIQSNKYQLEEYYILVLKDSSYEVLSDIRNKKMAIYHNSFDNYSKTLTMFQNDLDLFVQEYSTYLEASRALLKREVECLLISSSYKALLEDNLEDFSNKVRILDKEQVKIENDVSKDSFKDITNTAFNIYISGIDIEGDISLVSRSDVNMIVTVNPNTNKILLTSIPRDYYVRLPNTSGYRDKLTHSGIYGIKTTISTVENLLGIEIDYYARVNFTTVINLVDTIGGIEIYSDKDFRAYTNGNCYYKRGTNYVNGRCALAFARERYAYQEGDRHRIKNQQDVVKSILNKMLTTDSLITKYNVILNNLSSSFETDISPNNIYKLIHMQLDEMPSWHVEQISLDGYNSSNYTYSYPGQYLYVMEPNLSTIEYAKEKIIEILMEE